jgi:hypothetical protein
MRTRYWIIPTIFILLLLVACAGQVAEKTDGTPTNGGEEAGVTDSEKVVVTTIRSPQPRLALSPKK